jgi:hypothetical protein
MCVIVVVAKRMMVSTNAQVVVTESKAYILMVCILMVYTHKAYCLLAEALGIHHNLTVLHSELDNLSLLHL